MSVNDAQRRLTEEWLQKEAARMAANRPVAIKAICDLIKMIEAEIGKEPKDFSVSLLLHWTFTTSATSLAVSGQADGWFSEVYPWPDALLKALYS